MSNRYDLNGECGIGYTNVGDLPFYFDLEDFEKIKIYTWYITPYGYVSSTTFRRKLKITKAELLHRLILNPENDQQVDHINHIRWDNRKCNLRICTNQENTRNTNLRSTNTSGTKGVSWDKSKTKWQAYIFVDATKIHLGYFSNQDEAIAARKAAELQHFGVFNFDQTKYLVQ